MVEKKVEQSQRPWRRAGAEIALALLKGLVSGCGGLIITAISWWVEHR
ncbi:hypothetical protein GCM10027598_20890 [Amycolatopsis oliviviridis]|nr:hypothetical protein [Amycolatopsis oliviviridis]